MTEFTEGFRSNPNGYQITFVNRWTISVQWHSGVACSNRFARIPSNFSPNAEVAIIRPDGSYEMVTGFMSPAEIADLTATTAARRP